ncbi:increased DNA methylation 1 [Andrographis paniculata]|uniref:increased DNA methylation 1 n=1 Tax=Andrographis paniculata TaxID=175694 RepID=UPI0021E82A14|nr:increased DNA methylation 1 [Andrographis paniculata]XP_051135084.1 increased DNA methylation 1 [Andrographis paniculata]
MVESSLVLFSREIENLHDDGFEGSVDEQRIFGEVFFGCDHSKQKEFILSDTARIDSEFIKETNMYLSSRSGKSSLTSQDNYEKEGFSGNHPSENLPVDSTLSVKIEHEVKLSVGDQLEAKPVLGDHPTPSALPEGIMSGISQKSSGTVCRSLTYHLVESSGEGVMSGIYELRPSIYLDRRCEISGTGSSENNVLSLDNSDQKVTPSRTVTSPVSQESCANKLPVSDVLIPAENNSPAHRLTKPKWKDSCFVKLDDEELAMPKDIKNDPRPLLRYHINRLFIAAGWVIGRRRRNSKYNGIGEYVYKSPEGRPIREFHRAWCMCGESLSVDAIYFSQTSDCMQWTDMTELWTDLSCTFKKIDENLAVLETTISMAHLWCLLDPFANVVFIEKSIRLLKEGKTVKGKRSLLMPSDADYATTHQKKISGSEKSALNSMAVQGWGYDDTNQDLFDVPITPGSPQLHGGPETMIPLLGSNTICHIDQTKNEEDGYIKKAHKKSRKLSEMGLIGNQVDGKDLCDVGEISSASWGSKKAKACRLKDDDLLVSAIIKTKTCKGPGKWSTSNSKPSKKRKAPKGSCKLLPRSLKKNTKHLAEENWYAIRSRTILSWLLHARVVSLNEVIQYRNVKDDAVIKDGLVTREGILCKCCNMVFSISEFKNHAGFRFNRPCMNLYMESGKPFALCQLEAWSSECKARKVNPKNDQGDENDLNDDSCGRCGDVGELICCDNCPSAFHLACLFEQVLPEGNWYCPQCRCQICEDAVKEKETSLLPGSLKCSQCEEKYHEKCRQQKGLPVETDLDTWFCGDSCRMVYTSLQSRIGLRNLLPDDISWTLLRCISTDHNANSAVHNVALNAECNSKLSVAITIMEECFLPMVDTKTGVDMIPQVIYNWGSQYARLNYCGFYTVVLEKDDVVISVASIRIHGVTVAELPLIATCSKYRRQGMCRRLINSIEEMLKSLKVEMLVISAIPTLVHTWTVGFGFQPLQEDDRRKLSKINLMVFPGSVWLKKTLFGNQAMDKTSGPCNDVAIANVGGTCQGEECSDAGNNLLSYNNSSTLEECNGDLKCINDHGNMIEHRM